MELRAAFDNLAVSRLLWRDAQGVDGSVDLGTAEVLVGRAVECAVRTEDAMVSRHHARVFSQNGQYVIEDLGSANGVFFQEQRVIRHPFRHGDAVRCGSLWLRYIDAKHVRGKTSSTVNAEPVPRRASSPRISDSRESRGMTSPPTPAAAPPRESGADAEEIQRLRRRVEQLQVELRIYRGSGENAKTIESLDEELQRVTEDRDRAKARAAELEARLASEGGDAKVRKAGEIAQSAAEVVSGLNDVLSNLRINVMAAEGEFEQFSSAIPRASFELIREALRSSAGDVDAARELIRKLRGLG